MGFKDMIGILSTILVAVVIISFLLVYLMFPMNTIEFTSEYVDSNFNTNTTSNEMQFYPNMRYFSSDITYSISPDCSLEKRYRFGEAIEILENLTILDFSEVTENAQISVYCENSNKIQGNLFIVGEGGPSRILKLGDFNLITQGEVLLIKESQCPTPLVVLHEMFHALGFVHSTNPGNIMYNISNCKQTIGEDIPAKINELYSYPSYPDLYFNNISLIMEGRYLNASFDIKNKGFVNSRELKLILYVDDKIIKEMSVSGIEPGAGKKIKIREFVLESLIVNEVKLEIQSNFQELDKENNIEIFRPKK